MNSGAMTHPVEIATPALTCAGDTWRVEADVDGTVAWFESADTELAARPEAFATAFLGPALAAGRAIYVHSPVDPLWHQNVADILRIWKDWWGYDVANAVQATVGNATQSAGGFTASCFTGGADSSYTLLHSMRAAEISRLLFVYGYDISLTDEVRMAAWEPLLRRVAAERGKQAVVVRSNLRQHPLFRHSNWERTHGGALAAAGHVLAGLGRLVIPSSYTYTDQRTWGSHFETDKFWSRTGLEVEHDDATLHRRAKIAAIADEPLMWETLRVCWEGKTASGNCSMCEKCLRTMLTLHKHGNLDKFRVFDHSVPLARRILDLGKLPPHLKYVYEALLKDGLGDAESAAVRTLLRQSRPPGPLHRIASRLRSRLVKLFA